MSKPVVYAQLREVVFIPGIKNPQIGPTLPTNTTIKDLKMTLQDSGDLYLEWPEGNYVASFTISSSSVKGVKHTPVEIKPVA